MSKRRALLTVGTLTLFAAVYLSKMINGPYTICTDGGHCHINNLYMHVDGAEKTVLPLHAVPPPSYFQSRDRKQPYDWILTSYARSGSSITAQLLGHRKDTFYWFEPLYALGRHFWSKDKICYGEFDGTNCREPFNDEMTTQDVVVMLNSILACNFSAVGAVADGAFTREAISSKMSILTAVYIGAYKSRLWCPSVV